MRILYFISALFLIEAVSDRYDNVLGGCSNLDVPNKGSWKNNNILCQIECENIVTAGRYRKLGFKWIIRSERRRFV